MPRRRVLADVTPLRDSREFRLLYAGQVISLAGRQLTVVAVPYQVFLLTGSSLIVGLVSLAQFLPLLVGSLIGGAIADAVDRRRLMLAMQGLLAATSAGLAINSTLPAPRLWPLFVFSAASAGLSAVDSPTRSAVIPGLVARRQLPAAYALNQLGFQLAHVVGPALAGLVIARLGLAVTYWLDVASFGAAIAALLAMRPLLPQGGGTRAGLASMVEGLRFLRGRRVIQSTFYIDLNAMIFGMPRALFPELGQSVFGGGATTVGLLFASPAVGALIASLTSGWVTHVHRQGRAVLIAVVVWGGAIAAFGVVPWLPAGLALLALAGAADSISAVFRSTILQLRVPDRLRGRLSAVFIAVVTGGPRLGDLEAGAVAALTSARFAVLSGGVACIAGVGLIAALIPELARATASDEEIDEIERHAQEIAASPRLAGAHGLDGAHQGEP